MPYPLEHLLPTNIVQPTIQVLDLLHNILHLPLILQLNVACLANRHVQRHPDRLRSTRQPAPGRTAPLGSQTDLMLTSISGGEREAARVAVTLGDDAVVIVEDLVDGNEHPHVLVDGIRVRFVDNFGLVVSC